MPPPVPFLLACVQVEHQLRALIAFSFRHVPPEEFVDASTPLRFGEPLPEEMVGSAVLHASGAAARVAPGLLSRVGLTVASRGLSVVGAVVSTGDFVHSVQRLMTSLIAC